MVMFRTTTAVDPASSRPIDSGTRIRTATPVPGFNGKTGSPDTRKKIQAPPQSERQQAMRAANEAALKDPNVSAFLAAIGKAEGGGYDFMYGAVEGKKNNPWRMKNYDTHPGAGQGGISSPAGMYQINKTTWEDFGKRRLGITDFTPESQNLIAVEMLRSMGLLDSIVAGDIPAALNKSSHKWAALPSGPGKPGRYNQPYKSYEKFVEFYEAAGGKLKAGLTK